MIGIMRSIIFKLAFNVIKYTKVNVIAIYLIALIIEIYYFIFCKHGYVVYKKKYKKNKSKKNLFIHVITDSTISPSSKKLIDEYNNEGFYTVLINNINRNLSKLSDDFPTDVLINRPNIGRDLGAYKDGIKFFNDEKLIFSCKQLVMTNNSFVFKNKTIICHYK